MLRDWQKLNKKSLGPASLSLARDSYDDCLASLDRDLATLIDELERRNLLDQTLVILTADHGEQFGEHGEFGHGLSLLRAGGPRPAAGPLPGRVPRGRVVHEAVSLRDIPATVVDLIGGQKESPFPGRSLRRTWNGSPRRGAASEQRSTLRAGFSHREARPSRRAPLRLPGPSQAILAGSTVYIRHEAAPEELYDLDVDPTESRNLSGSASAEAVLAHCRRILSRLLEGTRTPDQSHPGKYPQYRQPVRDDP